MRNLVVSVAGLIAYFIAAPLVFVLLLIAIRPFADYGAMPNYSTSEFVLYYINCDHCGRASIQWQAVMFALCSVLVAAIAYGISRGVTSRGMLAATLLVLPAVVLVGLVPLLLRAWTNAGKWPFWFYTFAALPLALLGSWWGRRLPPDTSEEPTREE